MNVAIQCDDVPERLRDRAGELARVVHGLDHLQGAIDHVDVRMWCEPGHQHIRVRIRVHLLGGSVIYAGAVGYDSTTPLLVRAVQRAALRLGARRPHRDRTTVRGGGLGLR